MPSSSIKPIYKQIAPQKDSIIIDRAHLLWALRNTFHREGFLEIESPSIVVSPGLEPQLDAFEVRARYAQADQAQRCWLHTSPEYALKRFLSTTGQDVQRVYSLGSCFRDEPPSSSHSPEFTMLEWYARDLSLEDLMSQCETLIKNLSQVAENLGYPQNILQQDQDFERLSVREAFLRYATIDLAQTQSVEELRIAAKKAGIRADGLHGTWDEVYFQIFMDLVEPNLAPNGACFLYDFPASQAALAKLDPHDSRWARRFELFINGVELANAFDELSVASEQKTRFQADLELRAQRGAQLPPIDEILLSHLDQLGQCVGIALGFDRLVMLLFGLKHIDQVKLQPWVGL